MTTGPNAGRRGQRWRTLRANAIRNATVCAICGKSLLPDKRWPDPDATVGHHVQPVSEHPELAEDPRNIVAAHNRCNRQVGNRPATITPTKTTREW